MYMYIVHQGLGVKQTFAGCAAVDDLLVGVLASSSPSFSDIRLV